MGKRPAKRQSKPAKPSGEKLTHIGAYLPDSFRLGLFVAKGKTGDNVNVLLARAINLLFQDLGLPTVKYVPPPQGRPKG
jgi:hypothetical protein